MDNHPLMYSINLPKPYLRSSTITVVGLAAGAAFAHNFGLAASGTGVPVAGQIAVGVGFVIALVIAVKICVNRKFRR